LLANVNQLKSMNPTWKYQFYDDNDIISLICEQYGPHILSYYKRINNKYGAARADLFRYLLLYKYGGAYFDIKSTCTKPLDEVIQAGDKYLLSSYCNRSGEKHDGWGIHEELNMLDGGEFQQWHIICVPGHPFLRAVIDLVLTNIDRYSPSLHGTGSHGTIRVTGPIPYTLAIYPLLSLHPHRLVRTDAELCLSYSGIMTSHKGLFKTHYSTLRESIIRMSIMRQAADILYNFLYGIYNFVSKNWSFPR